MKVTRNVILDLLPLVLADEAHEDTNALVEAYLASDPKMAALAEQAKNASKPPEIPIPLTPETEMKSLEKTKHMMFQHNVFLFIAILFIFMFAISMVSLLDEAPYAPPIFLGISGVFWFVYYRARKQLLD